MKIKIINIKGRLVKNKRRPNWIGLDVTKKRKGKRAISIFRILIRRNR